MYFFISVILSVTFMFINIKRNHKLQTPVKIFNVLWLFISFLALLSINDNMLSNVSKDYIEFTITLFIFSFNLGCLLFLPLERKEKNIETVYISHINEKKAIILMLFILILLIFLLRNSLTHVISGNLYAIRASIYYEQVGAENSLYSSGIETVLAQWIINGVILALNIITVSAYFKKRCGFQVVFLSYLLGIVFALLTGGRIMILKMIIVTALSIFEVNSYRMIRYDYVKKSIMLKKKSNKLLNFIFLLIFIVIIITLARNVSSTSSDESSLFGTIGTYLLSPISYYSVLLDSQINEMEYVFGGSFFGGIFQWIDIFLKNVIDYNFIFPFQRISNETVSFLLTSSGNYYNAFPTMIYYFYRDFGLLGIVIGSLFLSYVISIFYKNYLSLNSIKNESLYLLFLYILVMGMLRWEPAIADIWITLIFTYLLSNKFLIDTKHNTLLR